MMQNIRVTGLDHIVLVSDDIERSLEFYTGLLGLEPERLDQWRRGEVPFPSLRITSTTIIDLFPSDLARALAGDAGTAESGPTRNLDHLCLVIEPLDLD